MLPADLGELDPFSLLDGLEDPVWVLDLDGFRMVWANAAACALWRVADVDAFRALDLSKASIPLEIHLNGLRSRLNAGQRVRDQFTLYPDGVPTSVDVVCTGVRLRNGHEAVLAHVPANAPPIPAEAMRGIEVLRNSPILVSLLDGDARPLMRNPAAAAAFGPVHDERGQPAKSVRTPDPTFGERVREIMQAGGVFSGEVHLHTLDGPRWFSADAQPVRDPATGSHVYLATMIDITERKETELRLQGAIEGLARKTARLEAILSAMPDGVQVLDEDLKLVEWNDRLFDVFEIDGPSILASPDPGLEIRYALARRGEFGPGDPDELVRKREAFAYVDANMRYERRSVTGRWIECRRTPVSTGGYLALFRDVTERREDAERLKNLARRNEELLHAIEATSTGITVADATRPDFPIVFANNAFKLLTGYAEEEVLGRSCTFLQGPGTDPQAVSAIREALAQQQAIDLELLNYRKDGSPFWNKLRLNPVRAADGEVRTYVGTQVDVSVRVALQKALAEAQRIETLRIKAAVDNATDAIAIADGEGRVVYVNGSFERLLGLSAETLNGSGGLTAVLPAGITADLGAGSWAGDVQIRTAAGDPVPVEARLSTIAAEDGQRLGAMMILTDISARLAAAREREQLQQIAFHAQKMEAIGTLAGGIAHDFNNVLSSLLGYVWLARQDLPESSPVAVFLDRATLAGDRATGIVRQLLTSTHRAEADRKPVDLRALVRDAADLVRASLPAAIAIEVETAPEVPLVNADFGQLHQVVMNLAINAGHALGNGKGRIVISLDPIAFGPGDTSFRTAEPARPSVTPLGLPPPGWYVRLRVSDDGSGIPPETLGRIFEPFFTTKGVGKGSGLGLASVHGIMRAHEGTIRVESEIGVGTVFDLYLPAIATDDASCPDEAQDTPATPAGCRILAVDDEPEVLDAAERMLRRFGHEVVATADPIRAVSLFADDPDGFDLVMTDFSMPGLRGDALARQIRAIRPDQPILLCTGRADLVDRTAGDLIVPKPLAGNALMKAIAAALARRRAA